MSDVKSLKFENSNGTVKISINDQTFEASDGTVEILIHDDNMFLHIPNKKTPRESLRYQIDPRHIKFSSFFGRLTLIPVRYDYNNDINIHFKVRGEKKRNELSAFFNALLLQANALTTSLSAKSASANKQFRLALRIE